MGEVQGSEARRTGDPPCRPLLPGTGIRGLGGLLSESIVEEGSLSAFAVSLQVLAGWNRTAGRLYCPNSPRLPSVRSAGNLPAAHQGLLRLGSSECPPGLLISRKQRCEERSVAAT